MELRIIAVPLASTRAAFYLGHRPAARRPK